jgi:archaellum component FlaC
MTGWMDILIATITGGSLSGVLTWFVSKRKRNNDFLNDLQGSINTLSDNYTETLNELIQVKRQNAQLIFQVEQLQNEVKQLKEENSMLIRKLNELKKLLNKNKDNDKVS